MKKIILSFVIASALFSCKPNSESTPGFDLENAKKEIASANQSFENFVSKGDSVGLATNCYTADAKFMAPNSPSFNGRTAVTTAISGIFQAGIAGIKLTTNEIWGNEQAITEEGSFLLNTKDGKVVEKGKYLVLWKKEDGKWKIHRDAFSSDMPLATK